MGVLRVLGTALSSILGIALILGMFLLVAVLSNLVTVDGLKVTMVAPKPSLVGERSKSTCPLRPESSRERELCERIDQLVRDRGR